MLNAINWNKCLEQIQHIGVTVFSRKSNLPIGTIEQWVYCGTMPKLDKALKALGTLGIDIGVKDLDEFLEKIRKYGVYRTARESGINIGTIRHWVYRGKVPLLDKVLKILEVIKEE